jgi:predicted metal-dependent HD superfamily phosphohydrolase
VAIDPSCLSEAELRARSAYAAPGRYYHDETHLQDCLTQLDALTGISQAERRLLYWAFLWHDAVYDPAGMTMKS